MASHHPDPEAMRYTSLVVILMMLAATTTPIATRLHAQQRRLLRSTTH